MAGRFATRAEAGQAWAAYKASNGLVADAVAGAESIHGNSLLSPRTAYLYRLLDEEGSLLKWGVTQDMAKRYPKWFMEDKRIIEYARGSRADMIRLERQLVETRPGPWNNEPWAPK
jgi:hypothetical protein